jgi:hypothetical protein
MNNLPMIDHGDRHAFDVFARHEALRLGVDFRAGWQRRGR